MSALKTSYFAGIAFVALASASPASAALITFESYNGNVGVSTDGFGSTSQSGAITASVPVGSTVLGAYLYSSMFSQPSSGAPGGSLAGQPINYSTSLGTAASLQAYRADVTSIVAPIINGGAGGIYSFNITETNASQDGEGLVVVYSNPLLPNSSVGILDGFSDPSGDSTSINFLEPLNPAAPGFQAEMRLGIGYSCCGQRSTVTVNGTTITDNAGNNDDSQDSFVSNGNLITVGGYNDPFSVLNPTYELDHERYNLIPHIQQGDTSILVQTVNPSRDDNIFLAVFKVTGNAGFNQPPTTAVPEPASLALLGSGLLGLGFLRRRKDV